MPRNGTKQITVSEETYWELKELKAKSRAKTWAIFFQKVKNLFSDGEKK